MTPACGGSKGGKNTKKSYYSSMVTHELKHYGIKGVRRTPEQLGHYKKSMLKNMIKDGTISTRVNVQKQNRHILGHKSHTPDRSYIFGSVADAQRLVDEYSGKGQLIPQPDGRWTRKERITCEYPVGVHIDKRTGTQTVTNKATIIYSKTGTHVMPRKDE